MAGTRWARPCRASICRTRTTPEFSASSPGQAWEAAPWPTVRARAARSTWLLERRGEQQLLPHAPVRPQVDLTSAAAS
ncbi:uncharacterized protein LOC142560456 isoform X3 [Dermacentor variabilis]|uniref:uncharacterized protein LOC142560456 isoform X3 n=1 Tax=Dermacentor variabilis TaxID=34621 RepID=UPI003F5BB9AC